jgi:hypothetical protein
MITVKIDRCIWICNKGNVAFIIALSINLVRGHEFDYGGNIHTTA